MSGNHDPIHIEGWEELAQVLGIIRGVNPEQAKPSVSLEMDSKGNVKPTVKVYHENPHEAYEIACEIFDMIRERYSI